MTNRIHAALNDILLDLTSVHARMYKIISEQKHVWSLSVQQLHRDIWQEYGWREWPRLELFEKDLQEAGFRVVSGFRVDRVGVVERIVVL